MLSTRLTQLVVALTVLAFPPALASLAVAPRPAGGLRVTVHLPAAPPQWGR